MTSLWSKLKSLVSASVREATRPDPTAAGEKPEGPPPEVTEASAGRREPPEVTEAPVPARRIDSSDSIESTEAPVASPRRQEIALAKEKESPEQEEALEEGRVADLLKDQDS